MKEFFKKHLVSIIIVGVCVIVCIIILIVQAISHHNELKQQTHIAYLQGKNEVLIQQSKTLLDEINNSLTTFKTTIDDTKTIITSMKEVSNNVSEQVKIIIAHITKLDNAYNTLYGLWSNSKRN